MESGLSCNIIIEKILADGVSSNVKYTNAQLSIVRNQSRAICLRIVSQKRSLLYRIKTLKIHGKFISSGKATIEVETEAGKRRILLSNASQGELTSVLKCLMVKFNCATPVKNKHLMVNGNIDEISPLRPLDMDKINRKLENGNVKNPTPRKNTTPVRRLQKRRILAERNGLISKKEPISKKLKMTIDEPVLSVMQQAIIKSAKAGNSIFFTGAAGTGKSHLLKELIKVLPPDTTAVTASTGCAAAPLHGQTLHAFAGIGIGHKSVADAVKSIQTRKTLLRNWKKVQILVIDEVSMVPADFFDQLEEIARSVRNNQKAFGGIQLILTGDFLQLPPVTSKDGPTAKFCFEANSWDDCIPTKFELREVFRQSADSEFCRLLNSIRVGQVPSWVHDRLKQSYYHHDELANGIIPTKLMTHNKQVESINEREFDALTGETKMFDAEDSHNESYILKLVNSMLPNVAKTINLKINSQVMLTRNLCVSTGLVNGSRGIVIGFDDKGPIIQFATLKEPRIISPERFAIKLGSQLVFRRQLPLRLAWAMSIHKSQGMSLDLCQVSLSNAFEYGQVYVALSRCRSFKGLRVLDFNQASIQAHPSALKFHQYD